jgi:hypothetical protein
MRWLLVVGFIGAFAVSELAHADHAVVRSKQPPGAHNPLPPLDELIPPLRAEYAVFRDVTLSNPKLSDEEKQERMQSKYREIEAEIKAARTKAYKAYYYRAEETNSCTTQSGTRNCPSSTRANCVPAPEGMHTTPAWSAFYRVSDNPAPDWRDVRAFRRGGWRDATSEMVRSDGTMFCAPNLRRSGNGGIKVLALTNFHYTPAHIERAVAAEVAKAMAFITAQ